MSTEVVVTLKEISCRNAGDLIGGTYPYIWPMLVWIDNKVNAACVPPEAFREDLGWGLKRGQTAAIPVDVGALRAMIDGELRAMFLIVPLLERSESSDDMMRAAFDAYCTELPKAVGDNLAELADPNSRGEAIKAIEKRVEKKAKEAAASQVGVLGDIAHCLGDGADDGFLEVDAPQLEPYSKPLFLGFAGTRLLSYGDDGSPGNVSDPTTVSHDAWGWFDFVFGSSGRVYAVDPSGQLLSFADDGTPNNIPDPVVVGFGGWSDFKCLFAGGNRIYGVNPQGHLLSYGDDGQPGNVSAPVVVGPGDWSDFEFLFAGGGRIYAVDREGQLLSYGDDGEPGNVSDPVVVGYGGWLDFKYVFAAGNRIYAVNLQGQLLSYGDDGEPGNVSDPIVVGFDDWQELDRVFGGGERIYALQDTGSPSIAYRIQGELRVPSTLPRPEVTVDAPVPSRGTRTPLREG
ncbi:MAG TPA: tachylectin-related carbohydrate-binding protein [Solirubrobacteraceae bacterium]|jgi:hypothetical protein|nr:tachylectin-related carbohydrate-binding protein [Solirubrobacteraceae bacterium]